MVVLPFGRYYDAEGIQPLVLANVDLGMLFILAISSLGYGIVLAGWASNSKYPFLGAIRASAQMIFYELAMAASFACLHLVGCSRSEHGMSLFGVVVVSQQGLWLGIWQPLSALIFLMLFVETNRLLDMAESETDLVGGFHTEYGAFKFGLFFVAEYAHIIGVCALCSSFSRGWNFLPFLPDPWGEGWLGSLLSVGVFGGSVAFMVFFYLDALDICCASATTRSCRLVGASFFHSGDRQPCF